MDSAPAVELAGYLDAAVGVGEAARRYVAALRSAGVPVLALASHTSSGGGSEHIRSSAGRE